MVNEALEHMYRSVNYANRIFSQDVQWVITVPAIWNDKAKQQMRVAARNAGLPESVLPNTSLFPFFLSFKRNFIHQFDISKDLILALEPEAAALCCRQNKKELKFTPGIKYMVVDCGGGTVDIVVHEIDELGMHFYYFKGITAELQCNSLEQKENKKVRNCNIKCYLIKMLSPAKEIFT